MSVDSTAASAWVLPKLDGEMPANSSAGTPPKHQFSSLKPSPHLDALMREAQERGHADGYSGGHEKGLAEGREAGRREVLESNQARATELIALVQSLEQRVLACDDALATELATVVTQAVELLMREELSLRPELVCSVVQAGLEAFVKSRKTVELKLHPDDVALVGEVHHENTPVAISPDPSLARGGCYLSNGETELDLTLEFRIQQMRQALAGFTADAGEPG